MTRVPHFLLGAVAAAALLAGCGSSTKLSETPVESRTPTPVAAVPAPPTQAPQTPAASSGTAQSQIATVNLGRTGPTPGSTAAATLPRIVYFDFDSFVVKDEFRSVIEGNAKLLSADRRKRVTIEGHADERGGREYNLALGQKRAEAVLKQLTLLGASDSQLEAVSFGEERPAVQGSDEAAWAKNRRAELKDR